MLWLLIILILILLVYQNRKWGYSHLDFSLIDSMRKYKRKLLLYKEWTLPINKANAIEGLEKIHEAFSKYNVFFFLSDGTALGATRNRDIIDYDDDVDINMLKKDKYIFINDIYPELIKKGFRVTLGLNNFYSLEYKNVDFDVGIIGKGIVNTSNWTDGLDILNNIDNFKVIYINDKKYYVPSISYLKYLYTDSWKHTNKKIQTPHNMEGVF